MIFRALDDGGYHAADAEHGVEFRIDRLRQHDRSGLVGELSVSCGILGTKATDGELSAGTFNFSHPREREDWARRLGRLSRTNGKLDWLALLEQVCRYTLAAERDGSTGAVVLRNVPTRPAAPMHDYLGLRVPQAHPACLFGPGDSLKSYLALALADALSGAGLRPGFFDWELGADEHSERQRRINPDMPDIVYVRCDRPLTNDVDRLRRIVRHERLDYLIVDSAGFGTDGKPEDAASALAYMRALRTLGVGALVLAHSRREDGDHAPFGSVFWFNSFRACWNLKRASTSPDGSVVTLGAFCRKFNLGPTPLAVGITATFAQDRVTFARGDIATVDELAGELPLWQRIRSVVRTGPLTLATIASELGTDKVDSIDRTVRRHKNLFTKVQGADGVTRVALVERRAS